MANFVSHLRGVPNLERHVQAFHPTLAQARQWAGDILGRKEPKYPKYPEAWIEIFEIKEVLVAALSFEQTRTKSE